MKNFGLFTLVLAILFTCNFQTAFAYPKPVAVIKNYSEVASGIHIQRANGTPNGSEALLYPGDAITGNVGYVKIECAPYADFSARNGAYIISYNPPSGIVGVAKNMIDYAASFWNNVEDVSLAASRGNEEDLNLNPQPGFNVTLMMNQNIHFAWDGAASKNFIIKNEQGKKIFEKSLNGNEIDIAPNAAKLSAGQKYIWTADNSIEYKFSVLDKQTEKEILEKLSEIDSENISPEERILKKVTYVQLISDIYPDKIDLYWLSAQWLSEISSASEQIETTKKILLKKCSQHLDEEM